jgi:hypothetical protein
MSKMILKDIEVMNTHQVTECEDIHTIASSSSSATHPSQSASPRHSPFPVNPVSRLWTHVSPSQQEEIQQGVASPQEI